MKNQKILLIIFLTFFISVSVLVYRPNYKNVNNIPDSELLIVAHRGFGNYAPDNSKSAVKIAIDSGMDGVDLDGQMTSDGELVIFHDPKLDRLTNGSGPLKDKTLVELRELDMGYKFDEKYTGEKISTYEEILQLVDGRLIVFVELKVSTVDSDGSEELAASLIKKYNAYDWAYLSSFNPVVLWRLKNIDPKIKTMFIFKDIDVDPDILKEISIYNPFFHMIDGLRFSMIGISDGSTIFGLIYLLSFSLILWSIAYYLYKKGYKIKS